MANINIPFLLAGMELRPGLWRGETTGYRYNGIALPKLPEAVYPYLMIARYIENGQTVYYLGMVKDRPFHSLFTYVSGDLYEIGGTKVYKTYRTVPGSETEWTLFEEVNEPYGHTRAEAFFLAANLVWTNFDVIADDGSVFMAAGTTNDADVPEEPAYNYVLPIPEGVTHCLYNGEKFPVLTPWNIVVYPYVFLCRSFLGVRELIASRIPNVYGYDARGYQHINNHYESDTDSWGPWSAPGSSGTSNDVPVWSNYDVYNSNGELKLRASDPVPVYE